MRAFAASLVSSLLLLAPASTSAQTVYGGAQTVNGLQNRANTRANMQLQERRNAETRRMFRAEDMIENQRRYDKAHPLKAPVLYVTADPKADTLDAIAKNVHDQYFKGEPLAQTRSYVRSRYDAYAAAVRSQGMRADNLATACDYAAESLYLAGAHIEAAPDRSLIRGACVMYLQANENRGFAPTNAARIAYLQFAAVAGSLYRDLDRRAAGDAKKRAFYDSEARGEFRAQFHMDMAATPPKRFVCVMANRTTGCDLVSRVYPKYAIAESAKYP